LGRSPAPGLVSRIEAEMRASQLLTDNLSPDQRLQFDAHVYFDVTGGTTGKRHRIRPGNQMNVEELDERGRRVHLLCFVPGGRVPTGDIMLAQKIALELFEAEALMVANRSPIWDYALEGGLPFVRRYRIPAVALLCSARSACCQNWNYLQTVVLTNQ
jgi:hypothetical protein